MIDEERLRRCAVDHLEAAAKSRDWWTPAGIFLTILLTFVTTEFKDVWFPKNIWHDLYLVLLGVCFLWLGIALWHRKRPKTIEDFIAAARATEAQVQTPEQASQLVQDHAATSGLALADFLVDHVWLLVFPENRGTKDMTFLHDGRVGDGANDNENRWRVANDTLEFVRSDGSLQSVFVFNEITRSFICAPVEAARRSSDGQRLILRS